MFKIWPWGPNPDYAIKVRKGTRGKWRWSLVFKGGTVAVSTVKGWESADEARNAVYKVLADIGASRIPEESS